MCRHNALVCIFSSIYSVMTLALTKEDIDSYAREHGYPYSDYPFYEKLNGCGGSWNYLIIPDSFFGISFNGICDTHDACYRTVGSEKDNCDKRFQLSMYNECQKYSIDDDYFGGMFQEDNYNYCLKVASVYYLSVRGFGTLPFKKAQSRALAYQKMLLLYFGDLSL